jgi:site-specific recombinase XerC
VPRRIVLILLPPRLCAIGTAPERRRSRPALEAVVRVGSKLVLGPESVAQALTRSGFEYILAKHARAATASCPSLARKAVSPHVLRHTCAMTILVATGDLRKVSLWLGHSDMKTTEVYLRADVSEKLAVAGAVVPPSLRRGRFRAPDALIASLRGR